ncbi:Crp/Fnr family transcriptional regulator [Flavihumibacter sp. ZG627]|uniref:Crp/Fnr family transcriptional regulator n=1 Tax=Flavihumibacter sp. ZG627 TaxID=1463156 RepID=UPI00069444AB|nr:Crp/Fnr family transcriptional regulator [Flavihumibacter sp. ZG627]
MPEATLKKYESALKSLYAFFNANSGLTEEQFKKIASFFIIRNFDRRQIVVQTGQTDDYFNYILKGVARKYIITGKKEITLQLSTEEHFIHSELSFHTRQPSLCFVEAIEPCVLLSLHYDHLQQLYIDMPELNKLGRLMTSQMYVRKELRDLSQIRLSARERFLQYIQRHPDMLQRVSQKYIASYLNIKPETFSRLKHLLRTKPK